MKLWQKRRLKPTRSCVATLTTGLIGSRRSSVPIFVISCVLFLSFLPYEFLRRLPMVGVGWIFFLFVPPLFLPRLWSLFLAFFVRVLLGKYRLLLLLLLLVNRPL